MTLFDILVIDKLTYGTEKTLERVSSKSSPTSTSLTFNLNYGTYFFFYVLLKIDRDLAIKYYISSYRVTTVEETFPVTFFIVYFPIPP